MQISTAILMLLIGSAMALGETPADRQAGIAASVLPPGLRNVGLDQRLNQQIPLYLEFRDDDGRTVTLSSYFRSKPVILALVYFQCPMLCTQVLNGLVASLRGMSLESGRDFEVIAVSINPAEGPDLARRKKEEYLRRYAKSSTGWHFFTGSESQIQGLARSVGFRYAWDERSRQFAHATAIMVLTPEGKLSRYFYGIEYAPRDLRLGLVEASQNRIGSPVDQLLLFCYHYDPKTGKYSAAVMNIVRFGGVLTVLVLGLLLALMWRRDIGRSKPALSRPMLRVR